MELLLVLEEDSLEIIDPRRLLELCEPLGGGRESPEGVEPDTDPEGSETVGDELPGSEPETVVPLSPLGWEGTDRPNDGGELPSPVGGSDPDPPGVVDSWSTETEPPPEFVSGAPEADPAPPGAEPPAGYALKPGSAVDEPATLDGGCPPPGRFVSSVPG